MNRGCTGRVYGYNPYMKSSRLEIRIEPHLLDRVKEVAAESGCSTSQLVEGLLAWAVDHAYPGLPDLHENGEGYIDTDEGQGVWFGHDGFSPGGKPIGGGFVAFSLDFRPQRVVRTGEDVYS